MAVRERDQADFDLERFVELFDECMTSDNPAVKKAFNNLLLVASIANSDTRNLPVRQGPLRRVFEDQRDIIRRIERLEDKMLREADREMDYKEVIKAKQQAMSQGLTPPPLMLPAHQLEEIKRNIK